MQNHFFNAISITFSYRSFDFSERTMCNVRNGRGFLLFKQADYFNNR